MTIKRRLILSHVIVFIVPIMITLLVVIISGLGLIIFARNGNHIYIESALEFQHACEVVHNIIFSDDADSYWLIGLLTPEQNFIRVVEEGKIIYSYGNESLQDIGKDLLKDTALNFGDKNFAYTNTLENNFVYFEKQILNGKSYQLYFVSERSF